MVSTMARTRSAAGTAGSGWSGPAELEQPVGETAHTGRQRRLQHQSLALARDRRELERPPDDATILGLERRVPGRMDEQRLGLIEEVVAGGPATGHSSRRRSPGVRIFSTKTGGSGAVGERRRGQPGEVPGGVEQPVGVIDPETVDPPATEPVEHLGVGLGEDLGILHVQRHEIVHVEEAAVVDLPGGAAPVRQTVHLGLEQPAQPPLAGRRSAEVRGRRLGERRGRFGRRAAASARSRPSSAGDRLAPASQRRRAASVAARAAAAAQSTISASSAHARMLGVERAPAGRQGAGQQIGGSVEGSSGRSCSK